MKILSICLTAAAVSTGSTPARALAQGDLESRIATLERAIPQLLERSEVAGLSVAIVAHGNVHWARGFGTRNATTGELVDQHTVFEAASLSKPVFAYAVMQMVERGELDLDRSLAEYFPYEDAAHDPRYEHITARMVLSHSTGFPNWRQRGGQLTINFEPGERFSYSGEGFVYLQRVVEQLTGEPMHAFMDRAVLTPLGMTRSSFVWKDRFATNLAVGHDEDGTPREKNKPDLGNAAWSLQTTAADFARFLSAVIGYRGLAAATVATMLSPQSAVDDGVSWGLGWGLQDTEVGRGFWHWGHNSGYRAYTLSYPEQRYGFAFFANSDNGMLMLDALLAHVVDGAQPGARWLDYEAYDAPKRVIRTTLERTIREQGGDAGVAAYHQIKQESPAEAFAEDMLNTLGYRLLRSDLLDAAVQIFQLNVEMYPDAFNTYDSLGEAYMERGDLDLAIRSYEQSVALNPDNTNGVQMLDRLRKMKQERGAQQASGEQRFFDWTSLQFSAAEYGQRRDALTEQLRRTGGGVLLVPSAEGTSHGDTFRQLADFSYLTGLELPQSMLAIDVETGRTILFAPPRDSRFESATRPNDFPGRPLADDPELARVSGIAEIVPWDTFESWLAIWATAQKTFRINSGSTDSVAFLRTAPIVSWSPEQHLIFHVQRTWPSATITSAYRDVARVRMIKSPAEVEVMRRAAALTARAIVEAARSVSEGVDERSLQGEFVRACHLGGAQRTPFTPIIKSGPNSLWPWRILAAHYDRRNRTMHAGDLVIFDVGCELDSYVSDVGRTFPVSGRFTDEQRELLLMITTVSDAVIDAVRPGVTLGELQAVADANIPAEQKQYMQTGFFIGHHLGLSTGDPNLRDERLQPGMIFTVEPWYYNHDREIAVFLEDEVLVTPSGREVLTAALPRSPEELERMVER